MPARVGREVVAGGMPDPPVEKHRVACRHPDRHCARWVQVLVRRHFQFVFQVRAGYGVEVAAVGLVQSVRKYATLSETLGRG